MSKRNTNKNKMWATNADIETCLAITTVSSKYRESIGKTPEGFLKTYKPLLVDLVKEFGGVVRSGAQIQNYVVNWLMHNTDYGCLLYTSPSPRD